MTANKKINTPKIKIIAMVEYNELFNIVVRSLNMDYSLLMTALSAHTVVVKVK